MMARATIGFLVFCGYLSPLIPISVFLGAQSSSAKAIAPHRAVRRHAQLYLVDHRLADASHAWTVLHRPEIYTHLCKLGRNAGMRRARIPRKVPCLHTGWDWLLNAGRHLIFRGCD
jgi:hypothetical protein